MTDELLQKRLKLQNYRNKDLIEGASWIYDQIINGEIKGMCFIIQHNHFHHTVGVLGDYRRDPYCALRPTDKLKTLIEQYATELEEHIEVEYKY